MGPGAANRSPTPLESDTNILQSIERILPAR